MLLGKASGLPITRLVTQLTPTRLLTALRTHGRALLTPDTARAGLAVAALVALVATGQGGEHGLPLVQHALLANARWGLH